MMLEVMGAFVTNYPILYNRYYNEKGNEFSEEVDFAWNDFLLCCMLFMRFHYLVRTALASTAWTNPRA